MIPPQFPTAIRKLLLLLAPFMLLPVTGCGYIVGGPYRQDVRTVHVPIFTSPSFRRDVEMQLTEAVHREIQKQTPFRLAKAHEADTKLTGRIISIRKASLGETAFDDVREAQYEMVVQVTWEDLRYGTPPTDPIQSTIPLSPSDVITLTSTGDFAPELGQSMATARQRTVDNLARQIVQLMQTQW